MTSISDIDENGINRNLKVRYDQDQIYVSFSKEQNKNQLCSQNIIQIQFKAMQQQDILGSLDLYIMKTMNKKKSKLNQKF